MIHMIKKAILPAAGLGTRFLPATKAQPKEMLPIVDKPTIQYVIEEAVKSGIEEVLIITGRGKRAIEDHFDKSFELEYHLLEKNMTRELEEIKDISSMVNIHYVRQKEPRGLGHAILCAKAFVGNEPFAVMLGDDIIESETPCLKQLIDVHDKYRASVIALMKVPMENIGSYGCVKPKNIEEAIYLIEELVEKPDPSKAPSDLAIIGRYIITPEIFEILEKTEPGKGGEIQLTDALAKLNKRQAVYGCRFSGRRYDVGDRLGYLKAIVEMALERNDLKDGFKEYLKKEILPKI
ncbi:MAG TPA: UTP--glucose-1-phosphate uridylyltransferase GalU [Candidatus Wallbacteria bacterium]|nr:UTP--glucose-1-phosphate uridylyltransferase GalU [Candidatus Wallbacteria bacterium]